MNEELKQEILEAKERFEKLLALVEGGVEIVPEDFDIDVKSLELKSQELARSERQDNYLDLTLNHVNDRISKLTRVKAITIENMKEVLRLTLLKKELVKTLKDFAWDEVR